MENLNQGQNILVHNEMVNDKCIYWAHPMPHNQTYLNRLNLTKKYIPFCVRLSSRLSSKIMFNYPTWDS